MKVFIQVLEAKSTGKFFANIDIHNKFFDGGVATIKTKEFASRKVCLNKAGEFCSTEFDINDYTVMDDIPEAKPNKKGGKKIGKK